MWAKIFTDIGKKNWNRTYKSSESAYQTITKVPQYSLNPEGFLIPHTNLCKPSTPTSNETK